MANRFTNILRGSFLTNDDALKNWKFMLFSAMLALIMIYSGHSLERKSHYISQLNEEVNELRSQYVEGQRELMFLQMESTIASNLKPTGIKPPSSPPQKITVKSQQDGND
ncbi:FtsL-like putative cell division protein [Nonlabens ponticola]|uniref:S-adenosyl-methyltransferase n=1 Tax=Nonlabens ponticola TaxID=2496866 RepID=A0A3S9N100_9FLAO|nr:FtsL-like putative cell division protein [Nonlabens ponticola]AZQ45087.1 S-adenosyl-methyltransferase [Nonlabens ponticola]